MNKDEARFAVSLAVRELYRRPSKMRMYDVINCSDRHAAACVAEAREPLVAALENYAIIENEDGNGQCLICGKIEDHKPDCLLADTAAAALAKETP